MRRLPVAPLRVQVPALPSLALFTRCVRGKTLQQTRAANLLARFQCPLGETKIAVPFSAPLAAHVSAPQIRAT